MQTPSLQHAARAAFIARWVCGSVAATGLAGAAAQTRPATESPLLRCELRYVSTTMQVEARPVADPYTVAAQDVGTRFRFKAVVLGTPERVDSVSLYAYDMAVANAPVLIHEVVHRPPFPPGTAIPALTGWNHVYSSRLGRELVYGCALGTEAAR
ncbi:MULTISPECIES: hypothetical protein [Rubrivivax]|uniref:hypothetical protein n=1 Tax=Rubrivivax TaxID=28067 RepID=UPI00020A46FB|nr:MULTISPECIES: hypothetical protein [Rubrivivax]EGJ11652.1 hypothetical protein RBXJA2T_15048 [Rubrivivax benzoatilyticus JA2 = ATCC BAA-35]MCC9597114.1 hypothetical protein [Rubrivivax sp. JA1055]MCC9646627.1 hypothetical protein [Rubrivivax sp. JA1029]